MDERAPLHRLVRSYARFTLHDAEDALDLANTEQGVMTDAEHNYLRCVRDASLQFLQHAQGNDCDAIKP